MAGIDGSATGTQSPIAIIGMGCLFPHAPGLREYWRLVRWSEDGVTEVPDTHWSLDDYFDPEANGRDLTYCKRGAFLSPVDFDPMEFGIPPSSLEATDTAQLLGLVVAKSALEDAGYGVDREFDRARTSVVLGVTGTLELVIPLGARMGHPHWRRAMLEAGVPADVSESIIERIAEQYVPWQENSFPGLLGNVVAGRIANRLNLRGTNCVVDAACASSLSAIHLAILELSSGRTDMVLSGGVDALNDIFMFMCFSKTQALSASGDARPFSKDADGTVIGEGIGMVVLKRLADAERDGDRIYAVIRGVGTSSDGRSQSIYAPRSEGQAAALRCAYRVSGVDPGTVQLVEAHGTGTKVGDVVEFDALTQVYREARPEGQWCGIGSVKSQIGHTKAASGVAGLIKSVLALHHKVLPATIKVGEPNPSLNVESSPFYLSTETRPWLGERETPRRSSVSSFGFGGSNFHAVLEEYGGDRRAVAWDGSVTFIAISADTKARLSERLADWCDFVGRSPRPAEVAFRACASRERFRTEDHYRLVVAIDAADDLSQTLTRAAERLASTDDGESSWSLPGVFFGAAAAGKIALLFPGQASQYVGMGRDLVCMFPEALDAVAQSGDIGAKIFPPPAFSESARAQQQSELTRTDVAQPAIGAVSLAMFRVLERFGVRPDFVAGHSYGELVALRAADRIDDAALRRLSAVRGRVMADESSEPGTMLAVRAPLDAVDEMIASDKLDVVVAHRNGPTQSVLSGSVAGIEAAQRVCASRGFATTALNVSAAFHSNLMAKARETFRRAIDDITITPGSIPILTNRTADAYPDDADAVRDMLADQLVGPVDFIRIVENLRQAGVESFIEVGPKTVLSGLLRSILGDGSHHVQPVDASAGRGSGVLDLARVLAGLAAMGHAVDVAAWEPNVAEPPHPTMAVALIGRNYRAPRKETPAERLTACETGIANDNGKNHVTTNVESNGKKPDTPGVRTLKSAPRLDSPQPTAAAPVMPRETPARPRSASLPAVASDVLGVVQEGLRAMQALQQQTAEAHARFLQGQELAQQTFQKVLDHQHRLVEHSLGMPVSAPSVFQSPTAIPEMPRIDTAVARPLPVIAPAAPQDRGGEHSATDAALFPEVSAATGAIPSDTATAAQTRDTSELESTLLEVVAELTGYPIEMLDPDMDLEADLGIDSIKRVEILAAVQTRLPNLEAVNSSYMGSLRTLRNIIEYMGDPEGGAETAPSPVTESAPVETTAPAVDRHVLRAVPLDQVAESEGIRIAPGREVWVLDDGAGLSQAIGDRLLALGTPARVVRSDTEVGHNGDAAVGGLIIVAPVAEPSGSAWDVSSEQRLKDAFALTQRVGTHLTDAAAGGGSLFATVSRMDGAFGLEGGAFDPVQGGLAGLAKTAAHEWPAVRVRALDVASAWTDLAAVADAVVREFGVGGPVEVGLDASTRRGLDLVSETVARAEWSSGEGDVIVISGGARGVTAEVAAALAGHNAPTLVLLGRSPAPETEPSWLDGMEVESEIKRALIANGFEASAKPTPPQVESAYARCIADREIRRTIARLESAGAKVLYRAVDVRDRDAVLDAFNKIRNIAGPVRMLVHGAGVIEDRLIADKSAEQFNRVFDTKVAGLRNLLEAVGDDDLRHLVLFSSVSGRFGRQGQVDYAMANEVLNKVAQCEARRRPSCRVVSINWGPWDGGMVTPALRKEFARIGVGLVPLEEGAKRLLDELASDAGDVEVTLGCTLPAPGDRAPSATPAALTPAFSRSLDIDRHPFLHSHVIGGYPVLPVAVILEWLGHAALHDNPGLLLSGFEEFRVLKGVVLTNGPADLTVAASKARRSDGRFEVDVALHSRASNGRETPHARARAILTTDLPAPPAYVQSDLIVANAYPRDAYEDVLFHGPSFQGIERVDGFSDEGMVAFVRPAPGPSDWMAEPVRSAWLGDPLAVDAGLQLGILWCHERLNAPSLPSYGAGYVQYRPTFPEDGVTAVLEVRSATDTRLTADVTFVDAAGVVVARMIGFEWTVDASLRAAFGREAVAGRS